MINLNKETMMIVAVVVALGATFYMYKELQKTKQDVQGLTTNSQTLGTQFVNLTKALARDTHEQEKTKDVDDMFLIMGALESLAGELACKKISSAQIDEVRALHYQMAANHKKGKLINYFDLNQRIHATIMAATKNTILCEIYALLAGRIRMARYRANFSQKRWDQAMKEHEEILDALSARDSIRLTQILSAHLKNTCETVKSVIKAEKNKV